MDLLNPYLTLSHLRATITPEQYQTLVKRYHVKWGPYFAISAVGDDFWESLPVYRIALCPFCNKEYSESLNTYGLEGWPTGGHESVYMRQKARLGCCPHFAAVDSCINFNGFVPNEILRIVVKIEVPCVTPAYLVDEPKTLVVMHSLPICRIEEGEFVPRYLLYTLVYFSETGRLDLGRQLAAHPDTGVEDYEFSPALFSLSGAGINVERWVKQGKVLWLDPQSLELKQWTSDSQKFPYTNINGYKTWVEFFEGEISFPYSPPKK